MKNKYFGLIALIMLMVSCNNSNKEDLKITDTKSEENSVKSFFDQKVKVFTTAKDTDLRLTKTNEVVFGKANQPTEAEVSVFVNPNKTFQEFLGIGGAITDASAEVFAKLSTEKQEELLQSYFGKEGIGYNVIRTNIHS